MYRPGHGATKRAFAQAIESVSRRAPVADSRPVYTRHLQLAFFAPQQAGGARASAGLGAAGGARRSLRGRERR